MPEVESSGALIHYEVRGEGAPLVMLHGMGGSFESGWVQRGWVEPLTRAGYRVIGIDARGCGESSRVEDPELLRGRPYVHDIERVMDAAGVERADVIGYSMGAGHTLGFAMVVPQRVRSIVLGGLGGIALAMAGYFHESGLHSREKLVRSAAMIGGRFAQRDAYQPRYSAAYFEAIARDPLQPGELESLALQTLIVVGEGDTAQGDFAALTITATLERRIPSARRIVLAGVDHATCSQDPRFKQVVLEFLQTQQK